jgi:hypothetical protein
MPSLYERFKFNEAHFTPDQIKQVKQEIIKLSEKLKPLEQEILNDPSGVLYIGKSMALMVDGFNNDLKRRIFDLAYSR